MPLAYGSVPCYQREYGITLNVNDDWCCNITLITEQALQPITSINCKHKRKLREWRDPTARYIT